MYASLALLSSVFILFEEGMQLEKAVAHVTSVPAKAVGLADCIGSLEKNMVAGEWR